MSDQAMQAHYTEKAKQHFEQNAYKKALESIIQEHNENPDCHYFLKCGKKISISSATLEDYNKIVSPIVLNDSQKRLMFMKALAMKLVECYGVKPYEINGNGTQERYGIPDQHRSIVKQYVNPGAFAPKYNDTTKHGDSDRLEEPTRQNIVNIPDHAVKHQLESILENGKELMEGVDAEETFTNSIANPHEERSKEGVEADVMESSEEVKNKMEEDRKNLV